MLYYSIYVKNLHNSTGYIDISLLDDQLMRDYQQFLDVGLKTHKAYKMATPEGTDGEGNFAINLSDIIAITVIPPARRRIPGSMVA